MLDLLVNAVCLLQLGLILERLVGRMAFTTVYVAAGVAGGIVSLSAPQEGMNVGMSGSILGMYGLLLVTSSWSLIRGSNLTIPLDVAKRVAPVAAIFVVYNVVTTGFGNAAHLTALACGIVGGIVAMAPTVQNEQHDGPGRNRLGSRRGLRHVRLQRMSSDFGQVPSPRTCRRL